MPARIALGTAQFGMKYGIANRSGQPDPAEVKEILKVAQSYGVKDLDTAIAYGDSESMLGSIGVSGWSVVSKLPRVPNDVRDIERWVLSQLEASLARLRLDRLYGLLVHDPAQFHGDQAREIAKALEMVRKENLAERVGVSIQTPGSDLPAIFNQMEPDLIQAPFNLLQDDLVSGGWAARLHSVGCEIHARSAFLQGLLLMSAEERPAFFDRWDPQWEEWQRWLKDSGLKPTEACLRFVRSQSLIDCCVVGVDSASQLLELLEIGADPLATRPDWPQLVDTQLINPSQWVNQ